MQQQENNNTQNPSEAFANNEVAIKKSKKGLKIMALIIAFMFTVVLSVGGTLLATGGFGVSPASTKLNEINDLVRRYYAGEIDQEKLDETLATAYMYAIGDKYGFYEDVDGAQKVTDSLEGNASGIGITIVNEDENKGLYVIYVDVGSPADKAGIQSGDLIIAIDDKTVAEMGYQESVASIKREIGEKAVIKLIRQGKEMSFNVVYSDFVRQSVYSRRIGDIGYFCFTAFNDATVEQFNTQLDELLEKKVKGLVFDMRDNGGGTVDSVCKILDRLVGKCDLITVKHADGSRQVSYTSDDDELDLPMAVLINKNTASAAELFSATMRDMKKAPLIGGTTYGKGVVQRTFYLSDGSCVRFTIGEFLPAGGESFNEVGLKPDYEVSFTEAQAAVSYKLGNDDPYIQKALECLK